MSLRCPECRTVNSDDSRFCKKCATPLPPPVPTELARAATVVIPSPIENLTPGTTFSGRYLVIEELGKGGMGKVYKVLDKEINEKVSLKFIRHDISSDPETIERFQNEIKITRKITHKNVCRMYHLGREGDTYYITMEYISGENLKRMIRMTKEMSVETTLDIAQQVCQGLAEAHRLGIIHRDLKPQNIMIDEEGNARIMDFGIASSLETKGATVPGMMIGTPEYMSPEQIDGGEVDQRSDIYSLGIIVYEMLTGRSPFEGETPLSVAYKHKNEPPEDPRNLNPDIPASLSLVILRCLEKQKEKRYQTAEELLAELKAVEDEHAKEETRMKTGQRQAARRQFFPLPTKRIATWTMISLPIIALIVAAVILGRQIFRTAGPVPPGDLVKMAVITFENQTGDEAYDYLQAAIPNLLITSLEQSKLIQVTSWERLRDLLAQLGKENVGVIDRDLGFELCRLDGIQTIILGSFVKAGDTFATDAKILDVESKSILKTVSSRGDGVESILKRQIDELSRGITREFGRPEQVTQRAASPITKVATSSLDAYSYFLRGREEFEKYYFADARRFLERALELDPEFALAHFYLARANMSLGDAPVAQEAIEKLKKYGGKVPGKDGLYIQALIAADSKDEGKKYSEILKKLIADYPEEKRAQADLGIYYFRTAKFDEAIAALNRALKLDPKYGYAMNILAYSYAGQEKFDQAIQYFQEYAAISPGDANPFDSMGEVYFRMGKLALAEEKFKEALRLKPDFGSSYKISFIHALQEDYAGALDWIEQYISNAPSSGVKSWGYHLKAIYCHLLGRTGLALSSLDKAMEYAAAINNYGAVNFVWRTKIWIAYDLGRYDDFMSHAQERFKYRTEQKIQSDELNLIILEFYRGLFDLTQNRLKAAKAKLAEIETIRSKMSEKGDLMLADMALYHLSTKILFAQGDWDKAMAEYGKLTRTPIAIGNINSISQNGTPYLTDIPAQIYLKQGKIDQAIAEYESLVSADPSKRKMDPLYPMSRFRLARVYEEKGERLKAIAQYEKLAEIWKDADATFSEFQEVKRRLAALKSR